MKIALTACFCCGPPLMFLQQLQKHHEEERPVRHYVRRKPAVSEGDSKERWFFITQINVWITWFFALCWKGNMLMVLPRGTSTSCWCCYSSYHCLWFLSIRCWMLYELCSLNLASDVINISIKASKASTCLMLFETFSGSNPHSIHSQTWLLGLVKLIRRQLAKRFYHTTRTELILHAVYSITHPNPNSCQCEHIRNVEKRNQEMCVEP